MKGIFTILFLMCFFISTAAKGGKQVEETASPTFGVTVERECGVVVIEKEVYHNATIELKAAELGDLFVEGVMVTVWDENGNKIYKKRFSKSFLYAYSDGSIYIARGNALTQVQVRKSSSGEWEAKIRAKGIY